MNTIKFQNSLDKLLADGQLANTNESFNTIMVINSSDAALLDFDTFKGSYLALSQGSYLDILPNNSLTIGSTRSTINLYFNL